MFTSIIERTVNHEATRRKDPQLFSVENALTIKKNIAMLTVSHGQNSKYKIVDCGLREKHRTNNK